MASESTSPTNATDFTAIYASAQSSLLIYLRRQMAQSSYLSASGLSPEDIAQETWLKIWRQWPSLTFRDPAAAFAYLYSIARRLLIDALRRQQMARRHGERTLTDELWSWACQHVAVDAPDDQPEVCALRYETQAQLRVMVEHALNADGHATGATGRDPVRDRALLDAWLDGEPMRVTAERLGVTIAVVKARQSRIRQMLRRRMSAHLSQMELAS